MRRLLPSCVTGLDRGSDEVGLMLPPRPPHCGPLGGLLRLRPRLGPLLLRIRRRDMRRLGLLRRSRLPGALPSEFGQPGTHVGDLGGDAPESGVKVSKGLPHRVRLAGLVRGHW